MSKRRQPSPEFRAKVALGASGVFKRGGRKRPEIGHEQVKDLHAKIGELAVANEFFVQKAQAPGRDVKRWMIEADHSVLSIGKLRAPLSMSRSFSTNRGLVHTLPTNERGVPVGSGLSAPNSISSHWVAK